MSSIKSETINDLDLTIHTCFGEISAEEMVKTMIDFYKGTPTSLVIWNFTYSSLKKISGDEVYQIVHETKKHEHLRPYGKTALVFDKLSDYGIGRMIEIISEVSSIKIDFQPFRDLPSAYSWLKINRK